MFIMQEEATCTWSQLFLLKIHDLNHVKKNLKSSQSDTPRYPTGKSHDILRSNDVKPLSL